MPPRKTSWSSVRMSTTLGLCRAACAGLSTSSAASASPRASAASAERDIMQRRGRAGGGTDGRKASDVASVPGVAERPRAQPRQQRAGPPRPRHMTRASRGGGGGVTWAGGAAQRPAPPGGSGAVSQLCASPTAAPAGVRGVPPQLGGTCEGHRLRVQLRAAPRAAKPCD